MVRVVQNQMQMTESILNTVVNHQTATTNKYHEQFIAAVTEKASSRFSRWAWRTAPSRACSSRSWRPT